MKKQRKKPKDKTQPPSSKEYVEEELLNALIEKIS